VGETLAPALDAIRARRETKGAPRRFVSPRMQVLNVVYSDVNAGLRVADEALEAAADDVVLRYVRAECLSQLDRDDEALPVWIVLASGRTPFAPALKSLATYYDGEGETDKAIDSYRRYLAIVPDDPRVHSALGALLRDQGDREGARSEFERAVASDPAEPARHLDLAECLLLQGQYEAANGALDEAVRRGGDIGEMVAAIMDDLYYSEESKAAEAFVAARPELFAKDVYASTTLARIRVDAGRPRDALTLLARCAELEPENAEVWCATATARRALRDWNGTLAAADKALELQEADAEAHYNRACALARLGKRPEAIAALKRAIEISDTYRTNIRSEPDFRALVAMPEFKALVVAGEQ
jgi:tetratricopeptide (TPR) repeat protein